MFRKLLLPMLIVSLVAVLTAQPPQSRPAGKETVDETINAKIRNEEMERSKIMWIEHFLTDVYGPRPTGSPNHEAAAKWAVATMTSWGMKNAHLNLGNGDIPDGCPSARPASLHLRSRQTLNSKLRPGRLPLRERSRETSLQ